MYYMFGTATADVAVDYGYRLALVDFISRLSITETSLQLEETFPKKIKNLGGGGDYSVL